MSIPEVISVARAKARFSEMVREAKQGKVFEVINRSEPVAIVISVEAYKALLESIEDLEDVVAVLQGELEDKGAPSIPWDEVKARYWAEHPEAAEGV